MINFQITPTWVSFSYVTVSEIMHLSILGPTTPIRDTGGDWCHEVRMAAKKVLVSWQSLGEPERSRVVTFIGELYTEVSVSSEGRK